MVWLNRELMCRRRIELGWTLEKLAEEAGLDRRTVQRLEQGRNRARFGTAGAVAKALNLELSALIVSELLPVVGRDDGDRVLAAFKAADQAIKTTLSAGGEWGVKEATSVLSLLLTRYGSAFGRRSEDALETGIGIVQIACDQAKRALPQ